jgi:hypothetical protein
MSQSYLPENLPSFLRRENLLKALVSMRTPAALALLGSLGIHGMVFVGLPAITHKPPDETEEKEVVKTIELTPAEQGRLPKISTPIVTLPNTVPPTGKTLPPTTSSSSLPGTSVPYTPSTSSYPSWYEEYNQPQTQARNTYTAEKPPTKKPPKEDSEPKQGSGDVSKGDSQAEQNPEQKNQPDQPLSQTQGGASGLQPPPPKDEYTRPDGTLRMKQGQAKLGNWLGIVQTKGLVANPQPATVQDVVVEFPDKYPEKLCKDEAFQKGEEIFAGVGILLNSKGELIEDPTLLSPTGSERLDKFALKMAKEKKDKITLEANREVYQVRVVFKPQPANCP